MLWVRFYVKEYMTYLEKKKNKWIMKHRSLFKKERGYWIWKFKDFQVSDLQHLYFGEH